MIRGTVMGEVWATRKCPGLEGRKLLLVAVAPGAEPREPRTETAPQRVVVAVDTLDAGPGDEVMVSFGSGARNVLRPGAAENRDLMIDAAISLVIEGGSE